MQYAPSRIADKFRPLFHPDSVAFVGASRDATKWGYIILSHLIEGGYRGRIYPINPREAEILGLKAYKSISDTPSVPDLAVIVVPPPIVPAVIRDCVARGIKAGVVITAGFAEVGADGERLQREMVDAARQGGMALVGPNGNGIMVPESALHPHMAPLYPPAGPVAVISQSGNVANSMVRRAVMKGFGISKSVSIGNEADLHFDDYLEYLAEDDSTKIVLGYIEGLRDGARFLKMAKALSLKKPIVVMKAGDTAAGASAARSHTASLAGSSVVFEAACKQAGVIRANDMDEMFNLGAALLTQPLPRSRRVAIVTAGGGWGVLAADACARMGLEVTGLPEETLSRLDKILPAWWTRNNPVDMVAGVRGEVGLEVVEIVAQCDKVDSVIALGLGAVVAHDRLKKAADEVERRRMEDEAISAVIDNQNKLRELSLKYKKPVLVASEMPFNNVLFESRLDEALGKNQHVSYSLPHHAAAALAALVRYSEYLRA